MSVTRDSPLGRLELVQFANGEWAVFVPRGHLLGLPAAGAREAAAALVEMAELAEEAEARQEPVQDVLFGEVA